MPRNLSSSKTRQSSNHRVGRQRPHLHRCAAEDAKASKSDFVDFAKNLGLVEPAVKDLIDKVGGDFVKGIKTLKSKDKDWILETNEKFRVSRY